MSERRSSVVIRVYSVHRCYFRIYVTNYRIFFHCSISDRYFFRHVDRTSHMIDQVVRWSSDFYDLRIYLDRFYRDFALREVLRACTRCMFRGKVTVRHCTVTYDDQGSY